jgi:hypothetical protein
MRTLLSLSALCGALILFGCKARRMAVDGGGGGSSLAAVNMKFDTASFPWADTIKTDSQKQSAIATMDLRLSVTSKESSGTKKCTVPNPPVKTTALTLKATIPDTKLTVGCLYELKIEIIAKAAPNTVFFETSPTSLVQTIATGGKIPNYQICLKNAGQFFKSSTNVNCIAGSSDDTDIEIEPKIGTGDGTKDRDETGLRDLDQFVAKYFGANAPKNEFSDLMKKDINWKGIVLSTKSPKDANDTGEIEFQDRFTTVKVFANFVSANFPKLEPSPGSPVQVACKIEMIQANGNIYLNQCSIASGSK